MFTRVLFRPFDRLQILLLPSQSSLEASQESQSKKEEDGIKTSATTSEPSPSHSHSDNASTGDLDHKPHRLIVVGRKRIPLTATGKHEVLWGKVVEVGDDLRALREKLGKSEYETKTLGRSFTPRDRYMINKGWIDPDFVFFLEQRYSTPLSSTNRRKRSIHPSFTSRKRRSCSQGE